MKKLFFLGIVLLVAFEVANVYFIMPLPYSQRMRSLDVAYTLYSWRWLIRVVCGAMIVAGLRDAWAMGGWRRAFVVLPLVVAGFVAYGTNFVMSADRIFIAPESVTMKPIAQNRVEPGRLVVGVELNGDARAYPIQFIGYHHQVRDTVGGTPVLVSFCTVCRTGRIFSPMVDGTAEQFRLVGMDHFNAMFEDKTTGSWWRQVNGEAVTGRKKGTKLAEFPTQQMTLAQWVALHPNTLIMQGDSALAHKYSKSYDYETGVSRSALTGTNHASWEAKSWVVGISSNGVSKAYDWKRLKTDRIINDDVGGVPVVIVLASDSVSFAAFERPDTSRLGVLGDTLVGTRGVYNLSGKGSAGDLKPLFASQEFWHSWQTFHPNTTKY
jgi:hypothetical protein